MMGLDIYITFNVPLDFTRAQFFPEGLFIVKIGLNFKGYNALYLNRAINVHIISGSMPVITLVKE
jgi:hypothetical protein